MSIDATRWAWRQQVSRSADKLVLLSLADRADENHRAFPSVERLSQDTCCDRKTIIRAVARLEESGLIRAEKSGGKVTIYELVGVENRHGNQSQKRDRSQNYHRSQKRYRTSTKNGTAPVPKTVHEPTNNLPRTKKSSDRAPKTAFRKPAPDELSAYCAERGNNVNPQAFFDYYESKGWVIGKSPMKDWKAAVRTWERRNAEDQRPNQSRKSAGQNAADFHEDLKRIAARSMGNGPVREVPGALRLAVVKPMDDD